MAKLIDIATLVQDRYLQDFASNDEFFDIEDFKAHVAITYSAMLNAPFQAERKISKAQEGFANVEINPEWTVRDTVDIKYDEPTNKYYANTEGSIFSFDFDAFAYAVLPVIGVGKRCNNQQCKFRRITIYEAQFQNVIPPVGVVFYYLNSATEFVFLGAKEGDKIEIPYIPNVVDAEDDCRLSDSIVQPLIDACVKAFFEAKNGNVIDKTNDQNPNSPAQQQVNPSVGK